MKKYMDKETYKCFAYSSKHNGWLAFNQIVFSHINVKIHPSIHIRVGTLSENKT